MNLKSSLLLLFILILHFSSGAQKTDTNAKVKAEFIYNFTKYLEWPAESNKGNFKIGVYSNTQLYNELLKMSKIKKVKRQKIEVVQLQKLEEISTFHLVFFNDKAKYPLEAIYSKMGLNPVLVVTDNYKQNETMIDFQVIDGNPNFTLNENELSLHKLKVKGILTLEDISEELFDEIEMVFDEIELQNELSTLKINSAKKDVEIDALKASISALESEIKYKESQLQIVQNKISKQENKLKRLQSSIGFQEKEYQENKKLADASRKDLEESRQILLNMKGELKNINHLLESQKTITYLTFFILLIIAGLGFVAFKNFKKQKKQGIIISNQKTEVEEKNKEITDSITYAKRIQEAILPPLKLVKSKLENSFIFYQPKDIVAGDFYWMEPQKDQVIFAAADCTGHGVPGAMVSVVCSNALNRAVREYGLTEPAKILDKTLEIVIERFEKSEEEVKDGMDIALCSYDAEKKILQYAGAHNPLWIIRKGATEVEEIKGNKQPIGKYALHVSFTNHIVQLNQGDSIYIFSDGYVDQFGGEKGKKYKSVNFKKLLLSIQEKEISEQAVIIKKTFEDWRFGFEQLDDVCVIGFRA